MEVSNNLRIAQTNSPKSPSSDKISFGMIKINSQAIDDSFNKIVTDSAIGAGAGLAYSLIKKSPNKLMIIGESAMLAVGALQLARLIVSGVKKLTSK